MQVDNISINEAKIPFMYRTGLPKIVDIINKETLEKYFKPIDGYDTVPGKNIYIYSDDYKFSSRVAVTVMMGFIARRVVCSCVMSILVRGMIERGALDEVSGWDSLTTPRVLGIFDFGYEPSNDFGKSISAIIEVLAYRRSVGLPTVISSDIEPKILLSDFKRFPRPLGDLILDDGIIWDVTKESGEKK